MLYTHILEKNKEKVLDFFTKEAQELYGVDKVLEQGISILDPWKRRLLHLIENFDGTPELICDGKGVLVGTEEFSEDYVLHPQANIRIPIDYTLSLSGVSLKNEGMILSSPIYPVSTLFIGGARYTPFYKLKNLAVPSEAYVSSHAEIVSLASPKNQRKVSQYISVVVYWNNLLPKKVEVVRYD